MATERQLQLEQVFRRALEEHGPGASTEFLIAATSEQTQADPREIIEAVEVVDRRPGRQGPDEGTGGSYDDAVTLLLALGKAVTAIWSSCPRMSSTNYSNTLSPLKMRRRESDSPISCMRYTFVRPMGSRHAPSQNPTV